MESRREHQVTANLAMSSGHPSGGWPVSWVSVWRMILKSLGSSGGSGRASKVETGSCEVNPIAGSRVSI